MTIDVSRAAPVADLNDILVQLNKGGRDLTPADSDARQWAGDALQELAEAAELLGCAVQRLSGRHNPAVTRRAHALATIIRAHRNLTVGTPPHPPASSERDTEDA